MSATPFATNLRAKLLALWRFSRPHTIYGTTASVIGLYLLALESWDIGAVSLPGLAIALVACWCANVYIVGLNQLFDVEIDRINKPYLPIPAGLLSWNQGRWIVAILGGIALLLALSNSFLFATVLISSLIGTAYSLPPMRLKRFPFFASLCIYTVRGLVVNVGLYLFFRDWVGNPSELTPAVWLLSVFVLLFTFAIAVFKDIPDMEGDYQFSIMTLSLKLGAKRTFHLCLAVLSAAYVLVAIAALYYLSPLNALLLGFGHLGALALLWWYRWRLPSWEAGDVYDYYQLIWKLFYFEYLLFPIAHLLGHRLP